MTANAVYPDIASRSAQVGTIINMAGDEVKFMTIVAPTVFTIINPILSRLILLELDGVFAVTLPASVKVIDGDYLPSVGKNYLFIFCNDAVAPEYLASWNVV